MISLRDSNITDILPESLAADPKVIALGYAINKAIRRVLDYAKHINIYGSIDTLPEQILDLLAIELNTQYYDDTLDIAIKRNLIKNTLNWYMSAGTPAAVTEMIKAVLGDGELEEWFEYGGDPYHFKIHTFNVGATDEMLAQIDELIHAVQNVRSQLEEVVIEIKQAMSLSVGSMAFIVDDVTLNCKAGD